jgi:3-oxoacyl-[acyl-carrier protein] reductase
MFDLSNKTALVTGATGGIGQGLVEKLLQQGATVIASGTRQSKLDELAAQFGARLIPQVADMSTVEGPAALVEAIKAKGLAVDILVNNAGITRDALLLRMKEADWAEVLELNLSAAVRLTKALIKDMMARRWGRIISISSVVGVMGNAGQTNYAAAKAGLIGFSKSLAQEVASRDITCNVIAPGFIATPMTDALPEEVKAKMLERIPQRRFGTVEDIAAAAVFLSSNESGYLTGQTLHINGGMIMI